MAKELAFFMLKPGDIIGDNVENAHVFEGSYDSASGVWTPGGTSRCGDASSCININPLLKSTDGKAFCHSVVEGHGSDFDACGACMGTFFATGK